jgi:opacity protein-like surface antigen
MTVRFQRLLLILVVLLMVAPVWAADETSGGPDIKGWGVRVGLTDDPNQFVVGAQYDFGEITDNVHFEPNVEVGFGDDFTILSATAAAHYHFKELDKIRPYAGAGVTLAYVDIDHALGNDSEFEIAIKTIGGVMWPLQHGRDFFLELNLNFGDIQETQLMAGWRF